MGTRAKAWRLRQVMEVQGNLSTAERKQALHVLATPKLKRTAKAGRLQRGAMGSGGLDASRRRF